MNIELDNPPFKARAYEDEYIEYVIYALDDSGEEDGAISGPHTSAALVEGILHDLIEDFPGAYFHVVAILRNGKDRLMDSDVVWSNYPDNESKKGESAKGANEEAGEPSDVKDIAAYIKSLDPQAAPVYDAFGNSTGTISFPKWYSDTKKMLFPCKFYSDADINKILKQGNAFISKKFGKGTYELTLEKVFSNAFHANCYAVRIKPSVKEASGANEKLSYEKGHKNSKGEDAPWVIRSHKDNSVLASFPTKKEAENHMRTMKRYSKTEGAPANEARSVSYFVLGKDTAELDAEEFVSTLEDAVLKDQSVETTAEPDGAIDVDIYGQLSPNEVERILQVASQLGIHISGLSVNI